MLAGSPRIEVVQPSGSPSAAEVAAARTREDGWAIASFNLLGVQAARGAVDREWVEEALVRLEADSPGPEVSLLRVRHDVLGGRIPSGQAADRYRALAEAAGADRAFTFDGVADRRRLDSYLDPFGSLLVRQRAVLEAAREVLHAGAAAESEALRCRLAAELSPLQVVQINAYGPDHVQR